MIRLTTIGLAVATALVAVPAAAQAAPPANRLTLTVTTADGVASRVTLTCRPAGGTHPAAAKACVAVTRAKGDLTRLPAREGVCTMQYDPVKAVATGRWAGRVVRFNREFGNACQLDLNTSGVFVAPVAR